MTDTDGPFDTKPWAEAQWARHAAAWAPSGVYGPPAASTTTGDLPLSVSGLSVGLGAGRAWVRGFGFERTGAAVMQAVTANTHASFSRRDRIVLRRNLATHSITPVLLTGTPGSNPAAPDLSQSEAGSWDLPLFSFLVPPNSGTGLTGVVDERGWINSSGPAAFTSTGARDAHFPAPTSGDACMMSGSLQVYSSSGWVAQTPARGTATFTTDSSGTALIAHGLGQVPSRAQVTPVFQSDGVSSLFKPMRAALTSTHIQVVCYRTDSVPHPRLLNTSVTVDWTAWP